MTRRKDDIQADIRSRLHGLAAYTPADHINEAEKAIERAERCSMAPAQAAAFAEATAHATLATAKAAVR